MKQKQFTQIKFPIHIIIYYTLAIFSTSLYKSNPILYLNDLKKKKTKATTINL